MRKIEQAINNAISAGRGMVKDNSAVTVHPVVDGKRFDVTLHGNHIASIFESSNRSEFNRMEFSFCGWQTPTTKGRIQALFSLLGGRLGVFQRKGQLYAYVGDVVTQIDAHSWYAFNGSIIAKIVKQ